MTFEQQKEQGNASGTKAPAKANETAAACVIGTLLSFFVVALVTLWAKLVCTLVVGVWGLW